MKVKHRLCTDVLFGALALAVAARTISTLTTVDRQWHRLKERWLCSFEKLSAMGFAISDAVAALYQVEPWIEIHCAALNLYSKESLEYTFTYYYFVMISAFSIV